MNGTSGNDRKIDLKELFFSVLYRWRSIIVCAAVLAILLGAYKMVRVAGVGVDEKTTAEISEEFEEDKEDYEAKNASYENSIANIEKDIQNISEYLEKSVLMNVDPYNIPMARADIYIKMDNTSDAGVLGVDPVDGLVRIYQAGIPKGIDWKKIKKLTGIKQEKYLEELVSSSASFEGNTVTINVYYEDVETAEAIRDIIVEQIEDKCKNMSDSVEAHSVVVVNQISGVTIDRSVADSQRNNAENLITFNNRLDERKQSIDAFEEPVEPEASGGISRRQVLKNGIKFGILGGVAGVFLMACLWAVFYLLSGKLHGESDIKGTMGIDVLGIYDLPLKKRPLAIIDTWLKKLEGKGRDITDEKVIERAVIQLRPTLEEGKKILITGTVSEKELQKIEGQLANYFPKVKFSMGSDLNYSVAALDKLAECDAVLIVEQREVSFYREVVQEQEIIAALDKPIVGCVLL